MIEIEVTIDGRTTLLYFQAHQDQQSFAVGNNAHIVVTRIQETP